MDIYETKAIWFEEDELQPVPPNAQYVLNLQESIAGLLAALEAVEWIRLPYATTYSSYLGCPWCKSHQEDAHAPDCQRQDALSKARGGNDD